MPQININLNTSANTAGFVRIESALNALGNRLASFGQSLVTGLGVQVVQRTFGQLESAFKGSFDAAFELAGEIHKGARALGVSAEAYQVLGAVMKRAGGDADQLAKVVAKSNLALFEARDINSKAAGAFRTLGLSVAEFERLSFEQRAERIGRAIQNSTDKTAAFAAASEILGARGLPVTLSALQSLARDGYDNLAKSMKDAGKVMQEDTVERLHQAEKAIAAMKKSVTIGVGESIGAAMQVGESLAKNKLETLGGIIKALFLGPSGMISLAEIVGKNTTPPAKPAGGNTDDGTAARLAQQAAALAKAEQDLALATLELKTAEQNQNVTEYQKREYIISLLQKEMTLRNLLLRATQAADLTGEETQNAKDLKIAKQQQEIAALGNRILRIQSQSDRQDARNTTRDAFVKFNQDGGPAGGGVSHGFADGAMNWVVRMGSMASQVASAIENTIGAAVSGITDGIMGWIEGTKSFAQMAAGLGSMVLRTMLQTIIQMGVQWLVNSALMKMGMITMDQTADTLRVARVAKENAAEAATLPAKTAGAAAAGISSFGVALAFGAIAIAMIAALAGGFSEGGFTSPGDKKKPAGIVHAGEWVAPQWMVKHPGFGRIIAGLEGARNGLPGFVVGGLVSPASALTRPAYIQPTAQSMRHHFYLDRDEFMRAAMEHMGDQFHEIAAREIRRNS